MITTPCGSCPQHCAAPIEPDDIRVIDGDTIRVHHQQPNVRLVGFNAPETRRARCEPERELGAKGPAGTMRLLVGRHGSMNPNERSMSV
jgi:endonuclease YncB( thermonuclease family)